MSTNAEETHNENSSLIERFPIENTPFTVWSDYRGEKEKHYLTMGNYKVSEDCETQEEARTWPENHKWELIITMIVIVGEKAEEIRKESYKKGFSDATKLETATGEELKQVLSEIPQG